MNFHLQSDIATRNVLLTHDLVPKLCDFGIALRFYTENRCVAKPQDYKVPLERTPIEYFKKQFLQLQWSDVWSYGVFLWEMFVLGKHGPYFEQLSTGNWHVLLEFLESGQRLSKPFLCPENAYGLMKECWSEQPTDRPSFSQIVSKLELWISDKSLLLLKEKNRAESSNDAHLAGNAFDQQEVKIVFNFCSIMYLIQIVLFSILTRKVCHLQLIRVPLKERQIDCKLYWNNKRLKVKFKL